MYLSLRRRHYKLFHVISRNLWISYLQYKLGSARKNSFSRFIWGFVKLVIAYSFRSLLKDNLVTKQCSRPNSTAGSSFINLIAYHGQQQYKVIHPKYAMPSTINTWKKLLSTAIWGDVKWAGFWQIKPETLNNIAI